jgi:RNA polymerase primary sigma factor
LHFLRGGRFVLSEKRAAIGGSKQAQQLKDLIARGKEQGYLTYTEVNDHLPNDIVDPDRSKTSST